MQKIIVYVVTNLLVSVFLWLLWSVVNCQYSCWIYVCILFDVVIICSGTVEGIYILFSGGKLQVVQGTDCVVPNKTRSAHTLGYIPTKVGKCRGVRKYLGYLCMCKGEHFEDYLCLRLWCMKFTKWVLAVLPYMVFYYIQCMSFLNEITRK